MEKKKNIYIVDDVQENLQVLGNILKKHDYNISIARNGEQALEGVATKVPDLILLDISMPGMDGYEVCKKLKHDDKTKNIPIIFLTARTQTEDIVRGFKVGGVDYVTKPFNSEELMSRVQTHLELKDAREKLVELNATKDKFFRIIGHDLKAPLSTLIGFTGLMIEKMDDYPPGKIKMYLSQLNENSQTTFKLIENLLAWARCHSNEIPFNPERTNITDLIDGVLSLLGGMAGNKGIQLVKSVDKDCFVIADRNMIETVLRNLVTNAIKFTDRGGEVAVKCIQTGDFIEVSVIDSGIGINLVDIEKLFRIDVHYTTAGTNNEKGTGLGLILCKEFIEKHGGQFHVESKVGEGTSFTFCIKRN